MTPQQFEQLSTTTKPDDSILRQLAAVYGNAIPNTVVALCATAPEGNFLDDSFCRKLPLRDIVEAKEMLHVDFPGLGILPVFDCGDNDFIVYCLSLGKWNKFNIVDEIGFRESEDWKSLI